MTPAELEQAFPELFDLARRLRDRGGAASVRLRCIYTRGQDGAPEVIAGKLPPPEAEHVAQVSWDGDYERYLPREQRGPYLGRER